ncbi:MAG: DUF1634 domain-containing protein [Candidatus Omnitrophica bacterium]|nr:DUF1634 domain-containing protein [Candidatus Omnitrophota bacterium]MDD5236640.1 DUF1634 domain-containing protein [Candidatus Omnitrophota bacterium]MDD5611097.1 DUF1634 domain-containing protein [Candidatus Omnitrophota bacterium]
MKKAIERLARHDMEMVIGNVLRAGVIIAAMVVLSGGTIFLWRHGYAVPNYKIFQREPVELSSIWGIIQTSLEGHGRGFIQLGLLLLIATPVTRVALSIFEFARQRDKVYVAVTSIVLCILLYSLFGR